MVMIDELICHSGIFSPLPLSFQTCTGVDYANFLEYALEQEGSLRLRDIEARLRATVLEMKARRGDTDLRAPFMRFDPAQTGAVSQAQFNQVRGINRHSFMVAGDSRSG